VRPAFSEASVYAFDLPIHGRFLIAELVDEKVTVIVRGPRCDTGVLRMDGTSQMEFIRTFFGRPAVTVLDLDFARKGQPICSSLAPQRFPKADGVYSEIEHLFEQGVCAQHRKRQRANRIPRVSTGSRCVCPAATTTIRLHHTLAARRSEHEDVSDSRYFAYAFRRLSIVRLLDDASLGPPK
jgi:hypothetical protein